MMSDAIPRRTWITSCILASGAVATSWQAESLAQAIASQEPAPQEPAADAAPLPITAQQIKGASWIARVPLTDAHCEQLSKELSSKLPSIQALRSHAFDENTPMAAVFTPWFFAAQSPEENLRSTGVLPDSEDARSQSPRYPIAPVFENIESTAFWSVRELGIGLRRGDFTSRQLTQMYLDRLQRYDPVLHCVVTLNPDCLSQADAMDQELREGKDRGPLHGIPWGAKDIIAVPGMPTTWGAVDYKDRDRGPRATVAQRMDDAGAVLLAKLSVGTLAWGDQWFRDMTRNPWNPEQGSSGSSAGSASAVVAGLCGFALGSETLGSIVSPCRVCCVTGLRPSFGRVSRYGCMTLGWSMDKIGPIARTVDDCGLIFHSLLGMDGLDPSVVERPYSWPHQTWDVKSLRVGVRSRMRKSESLAAELFEKAGATLVAISFETENRLAAMADAISIEAGAMHSSLFASIASDEQVGQWGPSFREASFCSAMDYVDSMRARVELIRSTEAVLREVDFFIGDGDLTRMNLTGHPSLVVALDRDEERDRPRTLVLTSKYFAESMLIEAGAWLQHSNPPLPRFPNATVAK